MPRGFDVFASIGVIVMHRNLPSSKFVKKLGLR